MKVIPPVTPTLISSTVPEPDATAEGDGVGAVVWDAGSTYAAGAIVTRPNHRRYSSVAGGNTNNVPENTTATDPPKWVDLGPTNRWRMLRTTGNAQTVGASPLVVVVAPGERIMALMLTGVEADEVLVEQLDASDTVVYTYDANMRRRTTTRWSEYFFGSFPFASNLLMLDLLPITGAKVRITYTRAVGSVRAGPIVLGTPVDLGSVELGATSGAIDFSRYVRDTFGNATLLPRRTIPRTSQKAIIDKGQVDKIRSTLLALRASSAMWIGIEDDSNPYFQSLAVLGIVKQWDINLDEVEKAWLKLEIEGI